jgi:hypothetical protein
VIVADTGAMIALFDRTDRHHDDVRALFEAESDSWVLPWAVLPEIDYLVSSHLGARAQELWLADLASGAFDVEWGTRADLAEADRLCRQYAALRLGLTDSVVIAVAQRLGAAAIATLDLRRFGAVAITGNPALVPRDRAPAAGRGRGQAATALDPQRASGATRWPRRPRARRPPAS